MFDKKNVMITERNEVKFIPNSSPKVPRVAD
jgi:hypothetical protein